MMQLQSFTLNSTTNGEMILRQQNKNISITLSVEDCRHVIKQFRRSVKIGSVIASSKTIELKKGRDEIVISVEEFYKQFIKVYKQKFSCYKTTLQLSREREVEKRSANRMKELLENAGAYYNRTCECRKSYDEIIAPYIRQFKAVMALLCCFAGCTDSEYTRLECSLKNNRSSLDFWNRKNRGLLPDDKGFVESRERMNQLPDPPAAPASKTLNPGELEKRLNKAIAELPSLEECEKLDRDCRENTLIVKYSDKHDELKKDTEVFRKTKEEHRKAFDNYVKEGNINRHYLLEKQNRTDLANLLYHVLPLVDVLLSESADHWGKTEYTEFARQIRYACNREDYRYLQFILVYPFDEYYNSSLYVSTQFNVAEASWPALFAREKNSAENKLIKLIEGAVDENRAVRREAGTA